MTVKTDVRSYEEFFAIYLWQAKEKGPGPNEMCSIRGLLWWGGVTQISYIRNVMELSPWAHLRDRVGSEEWEPMKPIKAPPP